MSSIYLDDLVEVITPPKKIKKSDYKTSGSLPVVDQGEGLIAGYTDDDGAIIQRETPLVVFGDHTRRAKVLSVPFAAGADGVKILAPKPGVDATWLALAIKAAPLKDRGYSRHYSYLRKIAFDLPALKDQHRIVVSVQEKYLAVASVEAEIDAFFSSCRRFRQALLRDAFTGRLVPSIVRPDDRSMEVPEERSNMPDGWERKALNEVCSEVEKVNPRDSASERFSYIDISSIDREKLSVVNPKIMLGADAPSRARQKVRVGDMLFSTVRPNLRTIAAVAEDLDGAVASTGFCVLRPRPDVILPEFLFWSVLSEDFQARVLAKARGVSYPAVRDPDILEEEIALPGLQEQEAVISAVNDALANCGIAMKAAFEIRKGAERMRAAVLHRAFTGRPLSEAS